MNECLQPMMDWLDERIGSSLYIRKLEQGDTDEVRLKLEHRGVHDDHTHALDDYTGGPVLYLRGEGRVIQPGGEELPLPSNTFLIPVEEMMQARMDGKSMTVETGRAHYDITVS
ncbi:hypothetical protein Q5741_10085 [Paenibacillus sp. JX-17]|uniref:Cupin domain-containing protein n=1 Tax=Paenibacillus lacisoli TaxID=3064525 RepID=A0ABT9CC08_9BACL|nr:hypothetical protein [Paenibacillus sp. JX-17]MDO7906772.1 hypothetical protein [Paenibacillus sp. JX-17]